MDLERSGGQKQSEETKRKISESAKKRASSEEFKKKMSEIAKKRWSKSKENESQAL